MSTINLITDQGECVSREAFSSWLSKNGFGNKKFNVISVLGSQSSGKSTLLNEVFGLDFEVMDTKAGHAQTTRGIWAGLGQFNRDYLVFDVEGTDSFERGDSNLTFEHQTSLFSLALADCLFVNLWYHNLGNRIGSNYMLLRTVFEANFEITQSKSVTDIVFLVRDWCEELAPLEVVQNKILRYMDSIWLEIKHPEGVNWDEYYNIRVFCLANKILSSDKFLSDCKRLRKMIENDIHVKGYSKGVPSDGLPIYVNSIWSSIKQQGHLDIPTQQEMLSTLRCHEFKNAILTEVAEATDEAIRYLDSTEYTNTIAGKRFSEWKGELVQKAVEEYLERSSKYDKSVSNTIGDELSLAIAEKVGTVERLICENCIKKECDNFVRLIDNEFFPSSNPSSESFTIGGHPPKEAWSKFNETVAKYEAAAIESYLSETEQADDTLLRSALAELAGRAREVNKNLLEQVVVHYLISTFDVDEIFMGDLKNLSSVLDESMKDAISEAKNEFNECIDQFKIEMEGMGKDALDFLLNRISVADVVYKRFERYFEIDENFIPRNWTDATQAETCFVKAKEEALALIDVLKENNFVKLTEAKETQVVKTVVGKMQHSYKRVQASIVNSKSSWSNIPFTFWVLLIFLGWNELMSILSFFFSAKVFVTSLIVISAYYSITWRGKTLSQIFQENVALLLSFIPNLSTILLKIPPR